MLYVVIGDSKKRKYAGSAKKKMQSNRKQKCVFVAFRKHVAYKHLHKLGLYHGEDNET